MFFFQIFFLTKTHPRPFSHFTRSPKVDYGVRMGAKGIWGEFGKPTYETFEKCEIFKFFKNWICGFGCVLDAKSPFFENFRKVWKFFNTFHTFSIFTRQVLSEIFDVEFYSKMLKKVNLLGQF